MNAPLTIVHILEKSEFNTGSVHQMFQAAEGHRARGHRVWIVSREAAELRQRCEAAEVGFVPLPLRHELDFASIRGIRDLVSREGVDVIHVHKGLPHTLALAATLRNRVPAFVVNRGVSFPLTVWNRGKYRTRRVDRVVTVCQQIKDVIVESGKLEPERVEVVYAGTDITLFEPARWDRNDFRAEKGIDPSSYLFAQVGVRDWKGWRELIDAFADVFSLHGSAKLALIAYKNEQQRAEVEAYAQSRGVRDAVIPIEYRPDIARVLASADCVVDASWAGTGITGTIREAMALRKPVIATDCGGNVELLSSSEVGWLVPPQNQAALAGAMRTVMGDKERAERVAQNAMERVRAKFSKQVRLDHLEKLYRSIVETKPLRAGGSRD